MNELTNYELGILSAGSVVAGIWLLILGGGWVIDASVSIASRAKLSKVFIGATIIAFGTSIPELFTSVNANLSGFAGISLGNIIGSNIANVLLVIGVAALFATLTVPFKSVAKDSALMLTATAIMCLCVYLGVFERWMGFAMFGFLALYVTYQFFNNEIDTSEVEDIDMSAWQSFGFILAGFAALGVGSELLVRGAVVTGSVLGVPEAIIGMTAVAIGTSLPELTASIAAVLKRETDLMFGNIIGSNTFNILSILGITAASKALVVDPAITLADLSVMAGVSVMFVAMLAGQVKITKYVGVAFLLSYVLFTSYQFRSLF